MYRAVFEGIAHGMQEAKKAEENTSGEQIIQLLAQSVMTQLNYVLLFDEDNDNITAPEEPAKEQQ